MKIIEHMNETFQVKRLGKHDAKIFHKLIRLFQEVFEEKAFLNVGESYLARLLEKNDFIVYVIISGSEIVGGLTAYELATYYSEDSEIFIYDIAIKVEFQRQGLGKHLISSLKKHCAQKGIKEMFVAADEEDEHAIDFYHSTGGDAAKVIHFNYSLNKE
ncbi:MAG: GNAT family N-acetyltransferase [Ginsengibacter sp.]